MSLRMLARARSWLYMRFACDTLVLATSMAAHAFLPRLRATRAHSSAYAFRMNRALALFLCTYVRDFAVYLSVAV